MLRPQLSRLRPLVVASVLSALLFACGQSAREDEQPSAVSEQAAPTQPVAGAAPAPEEPASNPWALPEETAPADQNVEAGRPQEITFGNVPVDEAGLAPTLRPQENIDLSGGRVFTNDALAKYRQDAAPPRSASGGSASAANEGGAASSGRPPGGEDVQAEVSKTRDAMAKLLEEQEQLKKRIPSLHNPLLPRVTPSDSDAEAEAGMSNVERLAHVNRRLSEIESELEALRSRLAQLSAAPASQSNRN